MDFSISKVDENYIRTKAKFDQKPNGETPPKIKLHSQPKQDTFTPSKVNQPDPQNHKPDWITKENIIIAGAGLVMTATAIAVGIARNKRLSSTLKSAQDTLSQNNKLIQQLKDSIKNLSELPNDLKEAKRVLVEKYQKLIQNPTLSYDPMKPVSTVTIKKPHALEYANKIFKYEDLSPFRVQDSASDVLLDTLKLKEKLKSQGAVDLSLPFSSKVKPVISSNANISGLDIPDLGKTVNSDFKLNYGKRVNWSEQKIARDILQNFYDGHGNTLDGVKLAVEKLPDGQYNIKISGLAKFDYENLQYMGSGSKLENPYNAGGFGEGAKVLVATMLGKGDTNTVKYASADWELTFDTAKGIIRRTLNKAQTPVNGNFIEFKTGNKKLADAILDSVNYFDHSQNPDFKGLHFDSKDFGFRFLEGDKKGNIYLTQRFAFGENGKWENSVENLDIIFKRKPSPNKFKQVTGKDLVKDRDRQFLTCEEIKDYTNYFATELSDNDLLKAIKTTEPMWTKLSNDSKPQPLKSFLEGLLSEAGRRRLAVDFEGTKYLTVNSYGLNDAIKGMIENYQYKACPDIFYHIGMPDAKEVFNSLKIHKAIEPTIDEIKKLKLLEEGIDVVKKDIDIAKEMHFANPVFKFKPNLTRQKFCEYMEYLGLLKSDYKDFFKKTSWGRLELKQMSDNEFEALKSSVEESAKRIIKKANTDFVSKNEIERIFNSPFISDFLDIGTTQYGRTINNFELIKDGDILAPRYIFDRSKEIAKDTLGEAIIDRNAYKGVRDYKGHWVDKEYFDGASFNDLLATWLHEICHKSGGDGTEEFTYTLTDMIQVLLNPSGLKERNIKLSAIQEVFDSIGKNPLQKVA